VPEDDEDVLGSGGQGNVRTGAAVFEKGVAFAEGPRQGSAVGDGLLEAVDVGGGGVWLGGGAVRIEDQKNAVIVFAGEFANHEGAGARRSLPVDVANAVGGQIVAQSVEILTAALGGAFDGALNAGKKFEKFRGRFDGGIDEGFTEEIEAAGLLEKAKREARHDAKGFLAVSATMREKKRDRLLHGLFAGDVGKVNGCGEKSGGGLALFGDALDAQRKRGERELFVLEFQGGAQGLPSEDVLRKVEAHFDAGESDRGEDTGHENAGNQTGEDEKEEIIAGVDGGERNENDAGDVDPTFAREPVFHAVTEPANGSAPGEDGNERDGNPTSDQKGGEGGSAGEGKVAELRGSAGIKSQGHGDGESRDGKEEGAETGAIGFGATGRECARKVQGEIPRFARDDSFAEGCDMAALPGLKRDADGIDDLAEDAFGGFGFLLQGGVASAGHDAMRKHGDGELFEIVGKTEIAAIEKSAGLRGALQHEGATGADA